MHKMMAANNNQVSVTSCWSCQQTAHHLLGIPLSLIVNGIVLQIEGIMSKKLLINKSSSELYFVNHFSAKLLSVTRQKEYS